MTCGPISNTYRWLLNQMNIPARTVQLATKHYVNGRRKYDTHVSVEVWDAQRSKWIISDPTFNVNFRCNGTKVLADFKELSRCSKMNVAIVPVENGSTYLKGRRLSDYYLPYTELLYALVAVPVPKTSSSPALGALEMPYPNWLQESRKKYQ